jgi:hypothetical protein
MGGRAAGLPEYVTAVSHSGQFIVYGPRSTFHGVLSPRQSGNPPVDLTPQTLAPSCEKVKGEILDALGQRDLWRMGGGDTGKILIAIDSSVRTNAPLTVAVTPFEEGWRFRIALPTEVTEERLLRVLVQAIVMELASRHGNERIGEPPLWLVEGLTQTILASVPAGVILQPQTRSVAEMRIGDQLAGVREQFQRQPPLEFHEVSLPDLTRMDVRDWELYGACAHLLVRELSRLPNGRERMVRWIDNLQQHWNWQSGFLQAFQDEFRSLLDVEKWWALTVANFTGRNRVQAWSPEFALRKLAEALRPVGIMPGASQVEHLSLEQVIADWDFARQLPVLRRFIQQMHAIRINAPPEIRSLVLQFGDAVEEYIDARARAGYAPILRGRPLSSPRLITRNAVARLRELEGERVRIATELEQSVSPNIEATRATPGGASGPAGGLP